MTKRDLLVLCIGAALGSTVAGQAMPIIEQHAHRTPACYDVEPLPTQGVHNVGLRTATIPEHVARRLNHFEMRGTLQTQAHSG